MKKTLYEKIKDRLKNSPGGYFGLEVCDHWFIIDPNKDNNTYQLQIFYDYRAGGRSHQGLETCLYTSRVKQVKKGYKKFIIRKIMECVITRVNYDCRVYHSTKKLDLDFKKVIGQIVKVYDDQGNFYGWRQA